jgi:NAD(P)-dependent dehydrogenase (short-subunit alcohol dehydrogenase family)
VATTIEATEMLRPDLLAGVSIVLARAGGGSAPERAELTATVPSTCTGLGARVFECELAASGDVAADDAAVAQAVARALAELGEVDLLLLDAASAFARERGRDGTGAEGGLVRALEASWRVTQAVANAAFIERRAAGRIVYVAPPPGVGTHAEAARAGLENLARTLSIEWARYGIAPVTIAPGAESSPEETAALVAYLASPAGDYFSGCLLDLRGAGAPATPGR